MVSGSQLEVWVDCRRAFRRLVPPPMTDFNELEHNSPPLDPDDRFLSDSAPKDMLESSSFAALKMAQSLNDEPISLYVGQRNSKHFLFKVRIGSLIFFIRIFNYILSRHRFMEIIPSDGYWNLDRAVRRSSWNIPKLRWFKQSKQNKGSFLIFGIYYLLRHSCVRWCNDRQTLRP